MLQNFKFPGKDELRNLQLNIRSLSTALGSTLFLLKILDSNIQFIKHMLFGYI